MSDEKSVSLSADPEEGFNPVKNRFQILPIAVGQGECTIIRCPDGRVGMIDCGTMKKYYIPKDAKVEGVTFFSSDNLNEQIKSLTRSDNTDDGKTLHLLNFVVLTHSDADHYNKLVKSLEGITVDKLYYSSGLNVIGEDCIYGDESKYTSNINGVPLSENKSRMINYTGLDKAIFFDKNLRVNEVIEIVITKEEKRKFTYTFDNGKINERTLYYGVGSNLNGKSDEDNNGNDSELIISGSSPICGEWEIAIIAGNVIAPYKIQKQILGKRNRTKATTPKKKKNCIVNISDDDEYLPDADYAELYKRSNVNNSLVEDAEPEVEPIGFKVPGKYGYNSKDGFEANSASVCTRIKYKDDEKNKTMYFLGDSTNLTFDYLKNVVDDSATCVLSNIPHHGSANDCNDCNLDYIIGDSDFIEDKLKPISSIFSVGYKNTHQLPKNDAIKKYTDLNINDSTITDKIDIWTNNTENWNRKLQEWSKTSEEREKIKVYPVKSLIKQWKSETSKKDRKEYLITQYDLFQQKWIMQSGYDAGYVDNWQLKTIPDTGGIFLLLNGSENKSGYYMERLTNVKGIESTTGTFEDLQPDKLNFLNKIFPPIS